MKVKKSKKYLGSLLAAIALSITLVGCGNKEVKKEAELTTVESNEDLLTNLPDIKDYSGNSLIEALSNVGYPTDFNSLVELAKAFYIDDYAETPEQNSLILSNLKNYAKRVAVKKVYTVGSDAKSTEEKTSEEKSNSSEIFTDEDINHDWQYYDADKDFRINENGEIEYSNHKYTSWSVVLGEPTKQERICGQCKDRQYREEEKKEVWIPYNEEYCVNENGDVKKHSFTGWSVSFDNGGQVRKCGTCKFREYKNVPETGRARVN